MERDGAMDPFFIPGADLQGAHLPPAAARALRGFADESQRDFHPPSPNGKARSSNPFLTLEPGILRRAISPAGDSREGN